MRRWELRLDLDLMDMVVGCDDVFVVIVSIQFVFFFPSFLLTMTDSLRSYDPDLILRLRFCKAKNNP
nr:hypothetical protein [Tanacetum cinerariifolium]